MSVPCLITSVTNSVWENENKNTLGTCELSWHNDLLWHSFETFPRMTSADALVTQTTRERDCDDHRVDKEDQVQTSAMGTKRDRYRPFSLIHGAFQRSPQEAAPWTNGQLTSKASQTGKQGSFHNTFYRADDVKYEIIVTVTGYLLSH